MVKKQQKLNLFENHTTNLQQNFNPPPAITYSSRSVLNAKPAKFRGWISYEDEDLADYEKHIDGGIFITSDRQKNGQRLCEYLRWKRKKEFGGSPSANENSDIDSNTVEDWSKSEW